MKSVETRSDPALPSAIRQATGAASAHTFAFGLSLVTGPILARSLGDVGRGEMAAVVVPVQLFAWIVIFGLPYASAIQSERTDRNELLRSAWLAAVLVTVFVSVPLAVIAPELRPSVSPSSLQWFRLGLLFAPLAIPSGVALRLRLVERGASWSLGVAGSLYLYLFTAAVIVLALLDEITVRTAIGAWIFANLGQWLFVLVRHDAIRRPARSGVQLVKSTRLGAAYAIGSISQVLLGRVDQVVMASTVPLRDLGVYAVAATAAQATLPLSRGIADTSFAAVLRGQTSPLSMTKLTFGLSLVVSVVLALSAPVLIPAIFGEPFTESVPLLRILLVGQVMFNTGLVEAQRFDAIGRPRVAARSMTLAAVFNVALIVPVTSRWGAEGAAALTSCAQFIFAGSVALSARRLSA